MGRIDKNIDVVILGASGYTGKIVYEYFLDRYKESSLVFAIAGRNIKKLEDVQSSLNDKGNTKILKIDTDSNEDIENLVKSTKCVLTTVGPYQLYGSKLVEACAKHGTDYVDLCGEPGWMHEMITSHKNLAQSSGARIVFSCGFDSIPFDLGVWFVQQEALKQKGKTSNHVRARVRAMNGQFSGGTIASLGATMAKLKTNPELFAVLANPFSLSEGFEGPEQPKDNKPIYDDAMQSWVAPFFMAPINTKNVHRTNYLLDHIYGEDFQYNEMWATGDGEAGQQMAAGVASANPFGGGEGTPQPGEGPTREQRENGNYDVVFYADFDDESITASVTGDMDPGYGSTSKMIAESALCLLDQAKDVPGGIYTPGSCMAEVLINRLEDNAGLTFKVE